jgi:hypothetical protein
MNGVMVVANTEAEARTLLEASRPRVIQEWTMADFADLATVAHLKKTA